MSLDKDRENLRKLAEEYGIESLLAELADYCEQEATKEHFFNPSRVSRAKAWRQNAGTLRRASGDLKDTR